MDKYLSIITNFGCHMKCPYCIIKKNGIKVPVTTIAGLQNLKDTILETGCNIVSVSGGGDPLHEYEKHKDYYSRLLAILNSLFIPLEMHTSYVDSEFDFSVCERVVYHVHSFEELMSIKRKGNEIVRAVSVVTDDMTEEQLLLYAGFVKGSKNIDELSFRQLVKENFETSDHLQDVLRKYHKELWWYIEQCDYNLYYVNGKIYTKFEDIGIK